MDLDTGIYMLLVTRPRLPNALSVGAPEVSTAIKPEPCTPGPAAADTASQCLATNPSNKTITCVPPSPSDNSRQQDNNSVPPYGTIEHGLTFMCQGTFMF